MKVPCSPLPFEWPVRVYWEDTDAGGIVFYANYLKFMERARTEWLRSLGLGQRQLREQSGGMFVVMEVKLQYHRPARLDDALWVTAQLMAHRPASVVIGQRVTARSAHPDPLARGGGNGASADAGTAADLRCNGSVRLGWVDAETLRPQRIPSALAGTLATQTQSLPQTFSTQIQ